MLQMWMIRDPKDPAAGFRVVFLFVFLFLAGLWDTKKMSVPAALLLFSGCLAAGLDTFCICRGSLQAAAPFWALIPGCFYLLMSLLTDAQIGAGDGISILILGLYCGLSNTLLITAAAQVLCAFTAAGLLIMKKAGKRTRIPFLPFLGGAALVLYLTGGIG